MKTIGFVLVALGVLALLYGGLSFNRNRTVLEIGSVHVTATERRSVPVPAVVGAVVLLGGVLLVVADKRRAVAR